MNKFNKKNAYNKTNVSKEEFIWSSISSFPHIIYKNKEKREKIARMKLK